LAVKDGESHTAAAHAGWHGLRAPRAAIGALSNRIAPRQNMSAAAWLSRLPDPGLVARKCWPPLATTQPLRPLAAAIAGGGGRRSSGRQLRAAAAPQRAPFADLSVPNADEENDPAAWPLPRGMAGGEAALAAGANAVRLAALLRAAARAHPDRGEAPPAVQRAPNLKKGAPALEPSFTARAEAAEAAVAARSARLARVRPAGALPRSAFAPANPRGPP